MTVTNTPDDVVSSLEIERLEFSLKPLSGTSLLWIVVRSPIQTTDSLMAEDVVQETDKGATVEHL